MNLTLRAKILFLGSCLALAYLFAIVFVNNNELQMGNYALFGIAAFMLVFAFAYPAWKKLSIGAMDVFVVAWFVFNIGMLLLHETSGDIWPAFHYQVGMVGAYFIVRVLSKTEGSNKNVFSFIVLLVLNFALIQGVIYILQMLGKVNPQQGIENAAGSFAASGTFSVFMAFGFIVSLWCILFVKPKNTLGRIFQYQSIALFLIIVFISPHTKSRTSWIIMALGAMVLLYFHFQEKLKKIFSNKLVLITAIIAIVSICAVSFWYLYNYKKDSADGRLIVWKTTLDKAGDAPLIGQGPNSFQAKYMDWQSEWFGKKERTNNEKLLASKVVRCYNDFLLELVEKGLLGLVVLLSLFIVPLFLLKKSNTKRKALYCSILLGIFAGSMVTFTLSTPYVALLFFLLLALIANEAESIKIFGLKWALPFKILLVIASVLLAYSGNKVFKKQDMVIELMAEINYYGTEYEAIISMRDNNQKLFETVPNLYLSYIWALHGNQNYQTCIDAINRFNQSFSESRVHILLGDCYMNLGLFEEAEKAYLKEMDMIPNLFFPLYKLQKFYAHKGDTAMAVETAKTLLDKQVKVPSDAIEEMKTEMRQYIEKLELMLYEKN